ncbi:RHS repeat-associated core domain-containing protein [Enterococcus gilvus]|uniref:RHS repeat-associated core domain-containing protein n=1 Tax=Enterococcus gilvus TaxID=160453 RepID=UPI002892E8EB|nr:RHS repeat-associated core domain-containing protein [Enterococcus gilvus]
MDDTGNPYGYTGEAQDVTGYNYLRARYYDSQSSTFLTQDSYEGEADNPLSQNGYTYVENNPVNYSDPTGHKKKSLWSTVSKILKPFYNTAKKFLPILNYFEPIVAPVIKYVKPVVNNFVPNVINSFFGKPIKPARSFISSGIILAKYPQQAANLFKNSGKALFETLTKFCKTAPKSKKLRPPKKRKKNN